MGRRQSARWGGPSEAAAKRYWRAADAREVLALWQRSGMTLTGFAQAQGLDRGRLTRWRSRLRGSEEAGVRFHRVQVVEDIPRAAPAREVDAEAAPGIEVIVAGGRRVVVRPGFVPDLLIQVLAVLEGQERC